MNTAQLYHEIKQPNIPTTKHLEIFGIIILDLKLTFSQHANVIITKAKQMLNILKALTSTKWGKQKELIVSTFKAITCSILEYADTIWSFIISNTNIKKLQTIQNTALQINTGSTQHTNTQNLHEETKVFPMDTHLKLHATQLKQTTQIQMHPLHDLNTYLNLPRNMKPTIFHKQ